MVILLKTIRRFSTASTIDKLFNAVQLSSQQGTQTNLAHLIENYTKQGELSSSNIIHSAIKRLATEQPKKEALWIFEKQNNQHKILTFDDIYKQSCRLAHVLTGKEYDLHVGQSILVMLPETVEERILLLLACLQAGLVFCPIDPTIVNKGELSQIRQRLHIDCVITDPSNIETVSVWTHNPRRPLKKGVVLKDSTSKLLPVGWNHLIATAADANSTYTNRTNIDSSMPVVRFISTNDSVIQYSQDTLSIRLLLTAFWLTNERIPRLIWMKNRNEIMSIAPWLFGSTIMYTDADKAETMFKTFEQYPIDAFCGSMTDYKMLENRNQENKTKLEQLFAFERIDPNTKALWHSVTNLPIHDDYAEFNKKSMMKYFSNSVQQKQDPVYEE